MRRGNLKFHGLDRATLSGQSGGWSCTLESAWSNSIAGHVAERIFRCWDNGAAAAAAGGGGGSEERRGAVAAAATTTTTTISKKTTTVLASSSRKAKANGGDDEDDEDDDEEEDEDSQQERKSISVSRQSVRYSHIVHPFRFESAYSHYHANGEMEITTLHE